MERRRAEKTSTDVKIELLLCLQMNEKKNLNAQPLFLFRMVFHV